MYLLWIFRFGLKEKKDKVSQCGRSYGSLLVSPPGVGDTPGGHVSCPLASRRDHTKRGINSSALPLTFCLPQSGQNTFDLKKLPFTSVNVEGGAMVFKLLPPWSPTKMTQKEGINRQGWREKPKHIEKLLEKENSWVSGSCLSGGEMAEIWPPEVTWQEERSRYMAWTRGT